jgi:uncharacterized protein involved in exopolysaccharide biosynthesis
MRWLIALSLLVATSVQAQATGATQIQLDLIDRYADLCALQVAYGPNHPSVVETRAELQAHASSLRQAMRSEAVDYRAAEDELIARIAAREAEIARLSTRYSLFHPEVQRATRKREALQRALTAMRTRSAFFAS